MTLIAVLFGSLAIGYLHSSRAPDLPGTRESIEVLVGVGCSALACLPLLIAAYYLETRSRSAADRPWRWLVWLLAAAVLPIGFWMFFTYLFGALGMSIRSWAMSIFEPA